MGGGMNGWVFVLMEYCIYCSGVLDGWMNGWMEYLY